MYNIVEAVAPKIEQFRAVRTVSGEGNRLEISGKFRNCEYWRLYAVENDLKAMKLIYEDRNFRMTPELNINEQIWANVVTTVLLRVYNANQSFEDFYKVESDGQLYLEFIEPKNRIIGESNGILLKWHSTNAEKLILNPGNIDVTGLSEYRYPVTDDTTGIFELVSKGRNDEQLVVKKEIKIARFLTIKFSNNNSVADPQYFMEVSASFMDSITLNPGAQEYIGANCRFNLPPSQEKMEYILTGHAGISNTEENKITIAPASIAYFRIRYGKVIPGLPTVIEWGTSNAVNVSITPGFTGLAASGELQFTPETTVPGYTLIVWGAANVVKQEIAIEYFEPPLIKKLELPLPVVKFKVSYSKQQLSLLSCVVKVIGANKPGWPVQPKLKTWIIQLLGPSTRLLNGKQKPSLPERKAILNQYNQLLYSLRKHTGKINRFRK